MAEDPGFHAMKISPGGLSTCAVNRLFLVTPTPNSKLSKLNDVYNIVQGERKGENRMTEVIARG